MRTRILLAIAALTVALGCESKELKITSVSPTKLETGMAVMVDINGQGFVEGAKVWFGGRESSQVVFVSTRRLVALLPVDLEPGLVDVKVDNGGGGTEVLAQALTLERRLVLTRLEPTVARIGEGDGKVVVHGGGFAAGLKVLFGSVESPAVEVVNDRMVSAALPELEPGLITVAVVSPAGARAEIKDGFQLLSPDQEPELQVWQEVAAEFGAALSKDPAEYGNGASFGDVDGDGWLDLVVVHRAGIYFFKGDQSGRLARVTEASLTGNGSWQGAFLGDFDHDGLPDMLVSAQPTVLFHNLGGFRFEDVTARVGLPTDIFGWSACWSDYDRDGRLDLFIGSPRGDNRLFHNLGGRFEAVHTELFNLTTLAQEYGNPQPTSFSASFGDYDRDGFPDLFVGMRGQPSVLYHNDQGRGWTPVTKEVGIDVNSPNSGNPKGYKMSWGLSWADFNNDGWLDLASSSIGSADLFLNEQGKTFSNISARSRAQYPVRTLSPAWGDFDNDGYQDIVFTDNSSRGLNVYRNMGDGTFEDVSDLVGISQYPLLSSMGAAFGDFNRDGALDLYVAQYLEPGLLFQNQPYPGRHYLEVELKGTRSNSTAIGAWVTVQSGSTVLTRVVGGGEAYLSQPSPILHFGLGPLTAIERLVIKWPSGDEQTITNVAVDQVLTVTEAGERKPDALPPPLPEPAAGSTASPPGAEAPAPGATAGH